MPLISNFYLSFKIYFIGWISCMQVMCMSQSIPVDTTKYVRLSNL